MKHIDEVLKIATADIKFMSLKAECLALLGHFDSANEIAVSCMQSDSSNADAMYVRALCLNQKDCDRGIKILVKAIECEPDHVKAKTMLQSMKMLKQKEEMGITFVHVHCLLNICTLTTYFIRSTF